MVYILQANWAEWRLKDNLKKKERLYMKVA